MPQGGCDELLAAGWMIVIRIRCVQCNCLEVVSGKLILEQSDFYGLYEVGSGDSGRDMGGVSRE